MSEPLLPVIDAHQHLWDPASGWYDWLAREPEILQQRFVFDDARRAIEALNVVGTVLVQAADHDGDTEAMLAEARANPLVLGVVGYLALEQPARAAQRLDVLASDDAFVGVRNLIHDQPDPDWLLRADVAEGLGLVEAAGLPFDLVAVLPRHVEHVGYLSDRFPDLTIVIDHLAKPPVGTDRRQPWRELITRAASNPRVVAKLSGLYRQGDGPPATDDDIRPWIADAIEVFGPDRLMLGSDWPVAEIAGGYLPVTGSVIRVVRDLLAPRDAARVLAGTATEVYGLGRPAGSGASGHGDDG
ncbi:MAG TPA: amidohydrolase family protein [Microlunatus sp.]